MGQLKVPSGEFKSLCKKWRIRSLAVFGSVLRDDFRADSDVDLLVEFVPEAKVTLFDLYQAELEFGGLFGRPVEIVSRSGLSSSQNWIRKKEILDSMVLLYAA